MCLPRTKKYRRSLRVIMQGTEKFQSLVTTIDLSGSDACLRILICKM